MKFYFNRHSNGKKAVTETLPGSEPIPQALNETEIAAVAALTIHSYLAEIASYENTVITMQRFMKPYSPWNSKFYGLRQQPLRVPRCSVK